MIARYCELCRLQFVELTSYYYKRKIFQISITNQKNADFSALLQRIIADFSEIQSKQATKKASTFVDAFLIISKSNYPKNEIKIPAATAEPITPDTLDDIQ